MGSLTFWKRMAIWAAEALRVQGIEKILVAFLFAQKIGNRKSHHVGLLK
jgi:hypothetical protein